MRRLIVNADDFGLTEGVNRGIIRAFREGIVTTTSLMANGCAFEDAVSLLQNNPALTAGIHIVLVEELPICQPHLITSLLDSEGRLHKSYRKFLQKMLLRQISMKEVEQEIRAQIEKVLNAEITPTHIDSHQHLHVYPPILKIVLRLAEEYGIKWIRTPYDYMKPDNILQAELSFLARQGKKRILKTALQTSDFFFGAVFSGHMTEENIIEVINKLPNGISELMCHPGEVDHRVTTEYSHWNFSWQEELKILISKNIRELIQEKGIMLIDYDKL